jgi:hypothetical protein
MVTQMYACDHTDVDLLCAMYDRVKRLSASYAPLTVALRSLDGISGFVEKRISGDISRDVLAIEMDLNMLHVQRFVNRCNIVCMTFDFCGA